MDNQRLLESAANQGGYWKAVIASISDSVVITDENGQCIDANQAALELAGVTSVLELQGAGTGVAGDDDGTGFGGQPVHPGRLISQAAPDFASFIAFRGKSGRDMPVHFTNHRGEEKDILVSFSPVSGGSGPVRYVFIGRDVTDLKRHEKMRQELLQTVSHELRNPLQVMKALVQLSRLKTRVDMDELRKFIDSLDRQVNHVVSLVEGVLAAYSAGEDQLSLDLQAANLTDLVRQAVKPYLHTSERRVSLIESARTIPVNTDAAMFSQVMDNLLSNAWKFTSPGGEISIHVGLEQESAIVSVEDDGEGIPVSDLERVFDGFHRPDDLSEWKSGGIGLGLFVSRSIIRRHGGDLWAERRPQGGTIMRMSLPLHGQLALPNTAS